MRTLLSCIQQTKCKRSPTVGHQRLYAHVPRQRRLAHHTDKVKRLQLLTNYGSLDLTDISILTGLSDTLGMARTIVHILTSLLSNCHLLTLES